MRRWEFRAADMPRIITDGYIVGYDRIKSCYNIYQCVGPTYDLILISSLYKIEREITRYEARS